MNLQRRSRNRTRGIRPTASRPNWYVTTAIPYVNAAPHVGFALEIIQADVLARYHRAAGYDVRFQTGTDENSLKNVLAAEKAGVNIESLVATNARSFLKLGRALDLSFDDFMRTSCEPRHRQGVERLWAVCTERGDIYRRPYTGLYCVGCEQFYKMDELTEGLCPDHGVTPERVSEENYFFRLSRYQDVLSDLVRNGSLRIEPETRRNEVLRVIEGGLEDFSISRSRARAHGWGIPVPGDQDQVIYVWFDALANYITALGYGSAGEDFERFWKNACERVHVIGKGITRFHALYWPAMLLSAGLPLPNRLLVHGYVTAEGEKISKSSANATDPVPFTREFGADALRYYLLRYIRSTADGDFSRDRFIRAYRSDLSGQLGNLAWRTLSMIDQYCEGVIPSRPRSEIPATALRVSVSRLPKTVDHHVEGFALHEALMVIWDVVAEANRYVTQVAPWTLAKQRDRPADSVDADSADERLSMCLHDLAHALDVIARCCWPFLPSTCETLSRKLGGSSPLSGEPLPGRTIVADEYLFPRF